MPIIKGLCSQDPFVGGWCVPGVVVGKAKYPRVPFAERLRGA